MKRIKSLLQRQTFNSKENLQFSIYLYAFTQRRDLPNFTDFIIIFFEKLTFLIPCFMKSKRYLSKHKTLQVYRSTKFLN